MTPLSPNFNREEFEKNGPFPDSCLAVVTNMCNAVLEPIRIIYGPMEITSGYRDEEHNNFVHGVKQSQHKYTGVYCAADCLILPRTDNEGEDGKPVPPPPLRDVFDWARLKSGLPIDQLILEHGEYGDILHISYALTPPRREALEGKTGNRSGYIRWNFVANPPIPLKPQV